MLSGGCNPHALSYFATVLYLLKGIRVRACACVYVRLICVCVCIVRRYVTPSVIYYDSIWWLKVVTAVMFSEGFFFFNAGS